MGGIMQTVPKIIWEKQFVQEGDFQALYAAEQFLSERGFSYGSGQRGAPTGIMAGDYNIAKRRNLSRHDITALHGILAGDRRSGPLTVVLYNTCPAWALEQLEAHHG